ncbi:MAG TPA: ROK family protein [Victivallales bacterium]|nr:ROK family protein [Victivallales bacterium]HRR28099.1 ROK family protein [Victivallales bacterium]
MKKEKKYLGFDIGGTKIAICIGDDKGNILASDRVVNSDRNPEDVIKDMINSAKNMLCDCSISESDISAIGIGAPGPADLQKGILLASPNMKKWDNIHLKDIISENFKSKVYFDNDANAGALAEWLFGVGQGRKNIIYLTMSTGIGGGIISEGVLLRGRNLLAGELGHVVLNPKGPACNCGLRGCYEAYCGGKAISQRILSDLSGQPDHPIMKIAANDKSKIGYPALIEAVKLKNGYALSLWDEICLRNSQAIGIFINIFNPEMIIMGTIAVAAGNLLIEPLKKLLPRFAWTQMMKDIELKTTSLGNKIGEYSGISIAKYYSESADSH